MQKHYFRMELHKWYYQQKWMWKMNYCKDAQIPPAQDWAWKKADDAYTEHLKK